MSRANYKDFEENESEKEIYSLLQRIDYLGSLLLKTLLWLVLVFFVIQILMRMGWVRPILSPVYRMEGVPMDMRNVKDWIGEK